MSTTQRTVTVWVDGVTVTTTAPSLSGSISWRTFKPKPRAV